MEGTCEERYERLRGKVQEIYEEYQDDSEIEFVCAVTPTFGGSIRMSCCSSLVFNGSVIAELFIQMPRELQILTLAFLTSKISEGGEVEDAVQEHIAFMMS